MLGFEFVHVSGERLDIFYGNGVIDACAHAAYQAMPLDVLDAALVRAGNKLRVELVGIGAERDVCEGAAVLLRRAMEELAFAQLRCAMASRPPVSSTQRKTLPHT